MDNPFLLDSLHDPLDIAHCIASFWRLGSRQPGLIKQVLDLNPGLPLATYNRAAEIAWDSLTPEERRAAADEMAP